MAMQSDHEFAPNQIATADFPTAFRGYDQDAVRHYLTRLASALEEQGDDALAALTRTTTLDRIEELEEENDVLRAELRDLELELVQRSVDGDGAGTSHRRGEGDGDDQRRPDRERATGNRHDGAPRDRSHGDGANRDRPPGDGVPFDEHRAIELLGQETARVLESARSAAADIVKRAEKNAKELDKEARSELSEARRRARRIVADKQKEAEELVTQVSGEAEEAAERTRAEAEQHRTMVLEETNRILAEAESKAESKETWARERAEQIVADAEALRQQILSELVVERTRTRTDLEEMTSARDRLVMALVVARSEVESLSDRLDEISVKTAQDELDGDSVVDGDVPQAEIDELIHELDARLPGGTAKGGDHDGLDPEPAAEPDGQTAIDLTGGSNVRPSTGPGQGSGGSRRSKKARSKRRTNRSGRTAKGQAKPTTGEPSPSPGSGAATALVDRDEPDRSPAGNAAADDVDGEAVAGKEVKAQSADTSGIESDIAETGGPALSDADSDAEIDQLEPTEPDEQAARIAGGLIEGFNTIEMTEADLRLSDGLAEHGPATDPTGTAVDVARSATGQRLDQVITTVASRSEPNSPDANRGDLLIDDHYRGRLAKHFSARDSALRKSEEFHRAMRRALNDDQSDVLDRLRAGRGSIEVAELPSFAEQLDRYLAPLQEGLEPVGQAGARAGGARRQSRATLDNLQRQLANYMVDRVRLPVIELLERNTDDDRERILEPIRTVYRDFRNTTLVDVTEDALYEAFAIGLYETIPDGAAVVWDLDPRHDPDPVCEINASRGDVVKGTAFPSGHARPLALPNCRCLVVPQSG